MRWSSSPLQRGYLRYEAENDKGQYVCQKKSGTGVWRLAHRANENGQYKIIYTAGTLKSCKDYAENYDPE